MLRYYSARKCPYILACFCCVGKHWRIWIGCQNDDKTPLSANPQLSNGRIRCFPSPSAPPDQDIFRSKRLCEFVSLCTPDALFQHSLVSLRSEAGQSKQIPVSRISPCHEPRLRGSFAPGPGLRTARVIRDPSALRRRAGRRAAGAPGAHCLRCTLARRWGAAPCSRCAAAPPGTVSARRATAAFRLARRPRVP